MDKIKSIVPWFVAFAFSIIMTPWIMVIAIKLALWPHLLSAYETEIILTMKGDIKDEMFFLKSLRELIVVSVLCVFSPLWLALLLWLALAMSYLFMFEVRLLTLDENSNGELL